MRNYIVRKTNPHFNNFDPQIKVIHVDKNMKLSSNVIGLVGMINHRFWISSEGTSSNLALQKVRR